MVTALIELTLWIAIFASSGKDVIGGFTREYYLAYVLWTAFITRITTNWMYETRMIDEVDSGSINGLLVRPMSFFEYYLSQLLGYKFITTFFSLLAPLILSLFIDLPFQFSRFPAAMLLVFYYLILAHIMSFIISCIAFHLNRVHSLTVAKNLGLWLLTGELIPIDLLPAQYQNILLHLPFSNAVYIPVSYITGRVSSDVLLQGFVNNTYGILILGSIAYGLWHWGTSKYSGTGA